MAQYLTKKDLLAELHRSKNSYCSYLDDSYANYHAHAAFEEITPERVAEVVQDYACPRGRRSPLILQGHEVVFRVAGYSHIPLDPDRKRKARNTDKSYARTNFPPFKHYSLIDGEVREVGRSHWIGGFQNGHFSADHGRVSDGLARMYMLLVERIASRSNWRNYSYLSEMQGEALVTLCANGLMFDESKSDNPFAFYTTAVTHSFIRVLAKEKRVGTIRDDMLQDAGAMPSMTRQLQHDLRDLPVPGPIVRKGKACR